MKILMTIHSGLGLGGAEVSTLTLAKELKKKGHDVIFASSGDYKDFKAKKFMSFNNMPIFGLYRLYLTRFFSKIIKNENIDIIHSQDRLTTPAAIKAAKKHNVPCISHFRDYWFACPISSCLRPDYHQCSTCHVGILKNCGPKYRFPWLYYKLRDTRKIRKTLMESDVKIAISDAVRHKLLICGITDSITVPNPVDMEFFSKGKGKKVRDKYGLKGTVALFVGTLTYNKGVINLSAIARSRPEITFLVCGNGSMKKELENISNVVLAGNVPLENMPDFYDASDFIVFPVIWQEGFGRVVLEAMASKKPVIASKVGGIKDLIINNKTGFLIDIYDKPNWLEKIDLLTNDKRLRDNLGKAGFERAKLYDKEIIAKRIIDIYKKCAQ